MSKKQKMNGFAQELVHRCAVMPIFVEDGFIPYIPEFDLGVDYILYREFDDLLIKVQQKGRWTIDRKYLDRQIAVAFPDGKDWYLIPHSSMFEYARDRTNILETASWNDGKPAKERPSDYRPKKGTYSVGRLSREMKDHFSSFRLRNEQGRNSEIYLRNASSGRVRPWSGETEEPVRLFYGEDQFTIELACGRLLTIPFSFFPVLRAMNEQQLNDFDLLSTGIWWNAIDEGLSISGLLNGYKPTEAVMKKIEKKL